MRMIVPALASLALAACGSPETPAADAVNEAANAAQADNGVNASAAMYSLNMESRNAVFLRAIRDSGLACKDVNESEQMEPTQGMPTWRAKCDDGDYHLVTVKPDGTAIVMSRPTS